jgi:hypothetical protein
MADDLVAGGSVTETTDEGDIDRMFDIMEQCMRQHGHIRDPGSDRQDAIHAWRENTYLFTSDADHKCHRDCPLTKIDTITVGCAVSGNVHICDSGCNTVYEKSGMYVCSLTGLEKGPVSMHVVFEGDDGYKMYAKNQLENPVNRVREITTAHTEDGSVPKQTPRRRPHQSEIDKSQISGQLFGDMARDIIRKLLYSDKRRKTDHSKLKQMQIQTVKEIRRYCKTCHRKNIKIGLHDVLTIYVNCNNRRRRVLPLDYDADRVNYYVKITMRLWQRMQSTKYVADNKSKIHFKPHVIGTLYTLYEGMNRAGVWILPQDDYLFKHLPPASDVSCYGYQKNFVTNGKRHISNALRSSKLQPHELQIRVVDA